MGEDEKITYARLFQEVQMQYEKEYILKQLKRVKDHVRNWSEKYGFEFTKFEFIVNENRITIDFKDPEIKTFYYLTAEDIK